jgi:diaminohydroxyphosphoribosylaminopyrimidine deaminase/5-amino-6-(5-phosphoribosylamino)uracil reductase
MSPDPQTDRKFSNVDFRFMARALDLATRGIGVASPNPTVGCVLVKDGAVIGEGFHSYDLLDHAEIVALRQAGFAASGATAYVTLEPCAHHGRTPPCSDALIAAGVSRVVVATEDPNPKVSGKGLTKLRAAGVNVEVGLLATKARTLNDSFAKFVTTGVPFVTLKLALSLDACIAPPPGTLPTGQRLQLTGYAACERVQQFRHANDAVVTGIGTILADDPLLTDRSGLPRRRPLLRVILDSHLRFPLTSRLVQSADGDVLVFCCDPIPAHARALEDRGVRILSTPPASDGCVSLPHVLRALSAEQIQSVLLESGAALARCFLASSSPALASASGAGPLIDKLALFYAPVLLGDSALRFVAPAHSSLQHVTVEPMDDDLLITGYLNDPWPQTVPNSAF